MDTFTVEGLTEDVAGFVSGDGDFIEVTKISEDDKTARSTSNLMQDDEDEFGEQYQSGRVYAPKYPLKTLKDFSQENTYHARCIRQKAMDSFVGWNIKTILKPDEYESDIKETRNDLLLSKFFSQCGNTSLGAPYGTFLALCQQMSQDLDHVGFAVAEIVRDKGGRPSKLNYMPAETCRVARYLPFVTDSNEKYIVQRINIKERVFKIFDGEAPKDIEPNTRRPMTECIFMSNFNIMDRRYGVPDWFSSIPAMIGNSSVAEYNINYFQNSAVPQFAVLVSGGKASEETKNEIKNYFRRDLKGKGNQHKTLVLSTAKDGEIKLVPLGSEIKDGSFRLYRRDNRDEIIVSHGIPPHRIQVYDSSTAGTIAPGSLHNMDVIYHKTVVLPRQEKFLSIFNFIIREGFKIHNKELEIEAFDLQVDKFNAEVKRTEAQADEKYITQGVFLVDEVRIRLGLKPYRDMAGIDQEIIDWATTPRPYWLVKQAEKAAQADGNSGARTDEDGVRNRSYAGDDLSQYERTETRNNNAGDTSGGSYSS